MSEWVWSIGGKMLTAETEVLREKNKKPTLRPICPS